MLQHIARDACIPLKMVILGVSTTDYHTDFPMPPELSDTHTLRSVARMANAHSFPASRFGFFRKHVFEEQRNFILNEIPAAYGAPLHSPNFSGLYDTLVITAECDPLVDEGEAYGSKIVEGGGKVWFKR